MADKIPNDAQAAYDAAQQWLKDNKIENVGPGIVASLARVMVRAVDEARAKRQQRNES